MRPPLMKTAIALLGLLAAAAPARAQIYGPTRAIQPTAPFAGPALSPYLNIVSGNNTPAINYYNGTRSLFTQQQLMGQVNAPLNLTLPTPPPPQDDLFPTLTQTGHLAGFQHFSPYFNTPSPRTYFPYNPAAAGQQAPVVVRPQPR